MTERTNCPCDFALCGGHEPTCPQSHLYQWLGRRIVEGAANMTPIAKDGRGKFSPLTVGVNAPENKMIEIPHSPPTGEETR